MATNVTFEDFAVTLPNLECITLKIADIDLPMPDLSTLAQPGVNTFCLAPDFASPQIMDTAHLLPQVQSLTTFKYRHTIRCSDIAHFLPLIPGELKEASIYVQKWDFDVSLEGLKVKKGLENIYLTSGDVRREEYGLQGARLKVLPKLKTLYLMGGTEGFDVLWHA
ncbi:hypothetical protein HDV00_008654 [Rhizophlyctis rosea]|nr:hypothetical protein HDV00_008654 [Rhizophlyctis rosea]